MERGERRREGGKRGFSELTGSLHYHTVTMLYTMSGCMEGEQSALVTLSVAGLCLVSIKPPAVGSNGLSFFSLQHST